MVLTPEGAFLGGDVDVLPCPVSSNEMLQLARCSVGAESLTALRADLATAVEAHGLRLHATPTDNMVSPLPQSQRPVADGHGLSIQNLRLLRVEKGQVLVWVDACSHYHALENDHLYVLGHLGATVVPPENLAATFPEIPPRIVSDLLAVGLIDEVSIEPAETAPRPLTFGEVAPEVDQWGGAVKPDPGDGRVPVWPVWCRGLLHGGYADAAPLGLGLVVSAIIHHEGGRLIESYRVEPIRRNLPTALADVAAAGRPGVMMLSTLLWTIDGNLALAAALKERSPGSVTVFGGPSAPKYEGDAARFFEDHPQVDVVVRGEGEMTAVDILAALDGDLSDLTPLTEVEGLTVRVGARIVRTPDRPRMQDLNQVPSPYLTGLFDIFPANPGFWVIETNRGCPYGCTFCDWGSATLSRVRKFDLERVKGEFEWLARRGAHQVFMADANWGIFERDIEITEYVCELRRTYGAPTSFVASNTKNSTKHILPIAALLQDAGMYSEATVSFQSTDETTLQIVRRKNIKQEVFEKLGRDAADRGIPVLADVMLGLPGATMNSLKLDLQYCIDQEISARVFGTIMLPNSPMNEPEYRTEHQIEVDSLGQVVATSSYTRQERDEMLGFLDFFRIGEHFGLLRQVSRYVATETDIREIEVFTALHEIALAEPTVFPLLNFAARSMRRYLIEPSSWGLFYEEVRVVLVTQLGIQDDSGLQTALRVQRALVPTLGRVMPEEIDLDHDYVEYYWKEVRPTSGVRTGRSLNQYGPGKLWVEDPLGICRNPSMHFDDLYRTPEGTRAFVTESRFYVGDPKWELRSALARPMRVAYGYPSDGERPGRLAAEV